MMMRMLGVGVAVVGMLLVAGPVAAAERTVNWPGFRGPQASGVAEGVSPPTAFDVEAGHNVRWRTDIPGLGHSSPVVWQDRIFITTAVSLDGEDELRTGLFGDISPAEEEGEFVWRVNCLDRESGEILWHRDAHQGRPAVARHTKATHANSTVATDGERVVAFFGSEGLYCYDLEGELLWSRDFGVLDAGFFSVPDAQWGFASSPVLHEDKVIIQVDVQGDSFVAALDAEDGQTIWRTERDEVPTWSTPTLVEHEGEWQVVVNGWHHIGGYRLEDGQELWWLEGGGDIPVPTPVIAHGMAYITNAHGGPAPLYAIDLGARGDITPEAGATESEGVVWMEPRNGAYMQTPLVLGDLVYSARDNGVLSCYDAHTGEMIYRERIAAGGGFTASPVAADGRLYFAAEDGQVFVVRTGREFELIQQNEVGEVIMATPAISGDALIIRTARNVTAIGE